MHRNISTTPGTNLTNTTTAPTTSGQAQYKIINYNNSSNWDILSTLVAPTTSANNNTTRRHVFTFPLMTLATSKPAVWKPAVKECTHIFSTYVVPNVFHFLAFLIGFYMFRIQESEGLHALIEKVIHRAVVFKTSDKSVGTLSFYCKHAALFYTFPLQHNPYPHQCCSVFLEVLYSVGGGGPKDSESLASCAYCFRIPPWIMYWFPPLCSISMK